MTRRPVNRTAQAASLLRACVFAPAYACASAVAWRLASVVETAHRGPDESLHPGEFRA